MTTTTDNLFALSKQVKRTLDNPETRLLLPAIWSKDELVPDIGLSKSPAVAVFNGQLYCVHEGYGDDGNLWYATSSDGKVWSKDTKLSDRGEGEYGTSGIPKLVVFNNKLYCFHQGREFKGQLWCTTFDGNKWSKDQFVPDIGLSKSPAVAVFNGKLYCVHEGMNNQGWLWYTTFDGNNWTKDTKLSDRGEGEYGTNGTPALVVFNKKLYCFHQGRKFSGQLWCTTFDGNRWSKDQFVPDIGLSKSPAVAVFNGRLYCVHEGMDDQGWLWYTIFDGNNWTKDEKLSDRGTSGTPALAVFNNKLYCFHQGREDKGQLWVTILPFSKSHQGWHQLQGANSYCYCACHSHDLKQKTSHSHTMTIEAGAPYFYAVLTKNDDSVDFPTSAVLKIEAPDGTVYNREVNEENLLVMMSGSSIQCLIVKDPMPGEWLMSMTAPEGIDFHCECNTIPSKDVYDTVTTTLRSSHLTTRLQKRDLVIDDPLIVSLASGWMGLAGIAGILAKSALLVIPALPELAIAAGVGILAYWWLNPKQQQQEGLELIQAAKGNKSKKQTAATLTTKAKKVNDNSNGSGQPSKDLKDAIINKLVEKDKIAKRFNLTDENDARSFPFLIALPETLLAFDTFSNFITGLRTIFTVSRRNRVENFSFSVQVTFNDRRSAWIRVNSSNLYLTGSNNTSHDISAAGWQTIRDVNYRNMDNVSLSLASIGNAAQSTRDWSILQSDEQSRMWGILAFVISEAARFEVVERVVNDTIFNYSTYGWGIFQPILTSWGNLSNQMELVPVPMATTRRFTETTTEYNDETRNIVEQIHDYLSNQQNNLGE